MAKIKMLQQKNKTVANPYEKESPQNKSIEKYLIGHRAYRMSIITIVVIAVVTEATEIEQRTVVCVIQIERTRQIETIFAWSIEFA